MSTMRSTHPADTAAPARALTLAVSWSLARGDGGDERRPRLLEIVLPISRSLHDFRAGEPEAHLIEGEVRSALELPRHGPAPCITDAETGLTHIDIPGVLHLSIRVDRAAVPLYVRTPILAQLGLAGGRYELARCSLA